MVQGVIIHIKGDDRMDIKVLYYFLTVAREESITKAAERLYMTQPPLSRQLKALEEELGVQLFIRESRKITLTEEGILLRKRAEEMVELMEITKGEIGTLNDNISGDVYIGGGETEGMRLVAKATKKLQNKYPNVKIHLYSGHVEDISERIDRGLLDFGIFIEPADMTKYEHIKLRTTDVWGVLMRKDDPLASKGFVTADDLAALPIICSEQFRKEMLGLSGGEFSKLNIAATYNLLYNASLLVEEKVGCALCIDNIINCGSDSPLCFRPIEPRLEVGLNIGWKKYKTFSKAAAVFLEILRESI